MSLEISSVDAECCKTCHYSILAYWDQQKGCGIMDDVMVLSAWRGRNIAKALIGEGLRYFHAQGVAEVVLEVLAGNSPAVAVYEAIGYTITNQEVMLGRFV